MHSSPLAPSFFSSARSISPISCPLSPDTIIRPHRASVEPALSPENRIHYRRHLSNPHSISRPHLGKLRKGRREREREERLKKRRRTSAAACERQGAGPSAFQRTALQRRRTTSAEPGEEPDLAAAPFCPPCRGKAGFASLLWVPAAKGSKVSWPAPHGGCSHTQLGFSSPRGVREEGELVSA